MNNNVLFNVFSIFTSISLPTFWGDLVSGKTIFKLKQFSRYIKKESKKASFQDAWIEQKTSDLNKLYIKQKNELLHQH